jgi:hypothetical protein
MISQTLAMFKSMLTASHLTIPRLARHSKIVTLSTFLKATTNIEGAVCSIEVKYRISRSFYDCEHEE